MEIVLCLFLGIWISGAGIWGYNWLKKEFEPYISGKQENNKENQHE